MKSFFVAVNIIGCTLVILLVLGFSIMLEPKPIKEETVSAVVIEKNDDNRSFRFVKEHDGKFYSTTANCPAYDEVSVNTELVFTDTTYGAMFRKPFTITTYEIK